MITGFQTRMARAGLRLSVRDLAKLAKISPATLSRVEDDQVANASTLAAIRAALEQTGVEFIDGDEHGVKLRKAGSKMPA